MCVRVFIGVSAHTCINICVYTEFLKKHSLNSNIYFNIFRKLKSMPFNIINPSIFFLIDILALCRRIKILWCTGNEKRDSA
jgi:hypothetical protein